MGSRIIEDKNFSLNQNTADVSQTAMTAADPLGETISYKIPENARLIIKPNDFCYLNLENGTNEIAATSRIVIEKTDPFGRRSEYLVDTNYAAFAELTDVTKKFFFGKKVVFPAGFYLKVKAAPVTYNIVTASTIFVITGTLVYKTID